MLSVNGVLLKVDKQNVGKVVSKIKMAVTTTVSDVDLKRTCRICLMKNKSEDLFCLFTSNKMFSDLTISTAILDCFGIPLQPDESLPNYVCITCASTTLQAYTFKKCLLKCQGYLMKEKYKGKSKEEVQNLNNKLPIEVPAKELSIQEKLEEMFGITGDTLENLETENHLKEAESHFEEVEDNCEEAEDIFEETVEDLEGEENLQEVEENLQEVEENLQEAEENLLEAEENLQEIENLETEEVFEETEDYLEEAYDNFEESENNLENHVEPLKNTVLSVNQNFINLINDDHNYSKAKLEIKTEPNDLEQFLEQTLEETLDQENAYYKSEEDKSNVLVSMKDIMVIKKTIDFESKQIKMISKKSKLRSSGPPYECKVCGKNYGVKFNSFYLHVRLHNTQKQQCEQCGKTFMRNKLLRHMRTHTNEKPYSCDHCSARFTIQGNLKRHLRCHTGEKLYVCDICGKSLTQSSSLLSHRQRHLGEIRHVCAYCGKTFTSDNSYTAHVHHVHTKEKIKKEVKPATEDLGIYPCEMCGRVFNKAFSLRIHSRWHESKKYFCDICKRMFRLHLNFAVHKYWHEIDMLELLAMPTKCKFCKDTFTEKTEFSEHILKHMELPFPCKLCNKQFASKATLKFHLRSHSDKRPFECTQCPKTFRSKATLIQHLKVHSGERPYECDVCLKKFAQQQQLNSHHLIHTGEKRHVCPFCGKAFTLNGNLTVHIRRHTGETPHCCDICGKGFYDTSSRKRHKETKHSVKVERVEYDPLIKNFDY